MSTIKTYSLRRDGDIRLSDHFTVREFRCKDGSDEVKLDQELVVLLQKIREHFDRPVSINSAYRTQAYNARVGGAKASQHLYGTAADIRVEGVAPRAVAEFAETLNPGGIGLYEYTAPGNPGFVHIDTRASRARWLQKSPTGGAVNVSGFGPATTSGQTRLSLGCKGDQVKELQAALKGMGYELGAIDGVFGPKTQEAVKAFQRANSLSVDGVVGPLMGEALSL